MDLLAHFNFRSMPFTREVLVSELFAHPQRDEIVDAVLRIIDHRMSGALIAPAGFGKTTLLRTVQERLPEVRYDVRYVKVTSLSKRDMCREIAAVLGLRPAGTYPSLVRAMQDAVTHRVGDDGIRTVLILDEAHDMRPDVLSMLRILTNFDMDSRLVLSVLLVGQPPLAKMLRRADLEDLTQRMAWFGTLRALSRDEVAAYVGHRCRIAGSVEPPFDDRAVATLYEMGRGNPRATDRLARGALEAAHRVGDACVGAQHVIAARASLQP